MKYFFHRYFGVGVEGLALWGHSRHGDLETEDRSQDESDNHPIAGTLGTLTLRYPFHCSRFSPYVWGGFGGHFNGSNDQPVKGRGPDERKFVDHSDNRLGGQVGGGLEVRITKHIGITGDFSWNMLEGSHNDFGLVRTGLNFAF